MQQIKNEMHICAFVGYSDLEAFLILLFIILLNYRTSISSTLKFLYYIVDFVIY